MPSKSTGERKSLIPASDACKHPAILSRYLLTAFAKDAEADGSFDTGTSLEIALAVYAQLAIFFNAPWAWNYIVGENWHEQGSKAPVAYCDAQFHSLYGSKHWILASTRYN